MRMGAQRAWVLHGHGCPVGTGASRQRYPWAQASHGHGRLDVRVPRGYRQTRVPHGVGHEHPLVPSWVLGPSSQEHFNYYSLDPALGHLVFSLKYDEQEHLHLLLR